MLEPYVDYSIESQGVQYYFCSLELWYGWYYQTGDWVHLWWLLLPLSTNCSCENVFLCFIHRWSSYVDDYDIVENTDCPGGDIYKADCGYESRMSSILVPWFLAVPCVMEDLIKLCNERPNCGGFNSNGFLKRSCEKKITSRMCSTTSIDV